MRHASVVFSLPLLCIGISLPLLLIGKTTAFLWSAPQPKLSINRAGALDLLGRANRRALLTSHWLSPSTAVESLSLPKPKALLEGYVSPMDLAGITTALTKSGFDTSLITSNNANNDNFNNDNDNCVLYRYSYVKATGMLKLVSHPPPDVAKNTAVDAPRWVPIVADEEHVLVQNGWSFLDPDESEPMSAFDVDAANEEGLYRPKWGNNQQHNTPSQDATKWKISALGYNLQSFSEDGILEAAATLQRDQTRRVLLQGATDSPHTKITHNGHDFSGSVQLLPEGIFVCAMGGLPLFTTHDISASTATSGWLSFARPVSEDHVVLVQPSAESIDQRIEVLCARTKCHLGHYFGSAEGYCINASALDFVAKQDWKNPLVRTWFQKHSCPVSFRSLEIALSTAQAPAIRLLHQMILDFIEAETVMLGAGCFWHVEFALRRLPGVVSTKVGFAGGKAATEPISYEEVCQGQTGHAEVVQVDFVPTILPPRVLFDCFLAMHDPTKVRAHGKHAKGTGQYRSCIFVETMEMKACAQLALDQCQSQLGKELSTELCVRPKTSLTQIGRWFNEAEERHQRHDEKRRLESSAPSVEDSSQLSTLDTTPWLMEYGRRKKSILGSSETLQ